ncbi:Probable transmembrane protein [Raoultella terrigena]|uniref:Probable transmembrane protein n=1 Tax=Raoultella terrigena TaxID=577 RepID=A0A7Z8Z8E8_RAOTE|nr:Probable transmembrane protein [Raoultella terrigena]
MSWQFVSFFGDSTVLLPSAAVLLIVLFLRAPSRQVACHWALLFGITGAIVSASKLAFMGWASEFGNSTLPVLADIPLCQPHFGRFFYGSFSLALRQECVAPPS